MSSLYLREDLATAPHAVDEVVSLHGDEQKHAVAVNRTRVGDETSIGDGRGLVVSGPVIAVSSTVLSIVVTSVRTEARPHPEIWLVQALAKGDRDELAVQAATELGVMRVVPWAAERSVSRWVGPKLAKGRQRWQSIVREATKQSIRAWVPDVGELVGIRELVTLAASSRMLVLEPTATRGLSAALDADPATDPARPVVLIVGPEGGITPHERDLLTAAGATPVRLGDGVLRTSTAGPAAIAALNATLGIW